MRSSADYVKVEVEEEIKKDDCTIFIKTSGGNGEILSDTCTEPLLTSYGSGDNIYQVVLPQIRDEPDKVYFLLLTSLAQNTSNAR